MDLMSLMNTGFKNVLDYNSPYDPNGKGNMVEWRDGSSNGYTQEDLEKAAKAQAQFERDQSWMNQHPGTEAAKMYAQAPPIQMMTPESMGSLMSMSMQRPQQVQSPGMPYQNKYLASLMGRL